MADNQPMPHTLVLGCDSVGVNVTAVYTEDGGEDILKTTCFEGSEVDRRATEYLESVIGHNTQVVYAKDNRAGFTSTRVATLNALVSVARRAASNYRKAAVKRGVSDSRIDGQE